MDARRMCRVPPEARPSRWTTAGFVLLLTASFAPPYAVAQKKPKPLAKHEVIYLLANFPSAQVAEIVREEGIDFELTPETEKDLRAAGASDSLLEVIRQLGPKGPVLVIESNPGNAQVFVDDELIAGTSAEGRLRISTLTPGGHRVRISKEGYQDYGRALDLALGRTETVRATLELVSPQPVAPGPASPSASAEAARALRMRREGGVGAHLANPQWRSREEYDAYMAMANEKDLSRRTSLAEAFIQAHADSNFKTTAYTEMAKAYLELKDLPRCIVAADKALDADPDNLQALTLLSYVFPYAFQLSDPGSAAKLSQAEADARHGLEMLGKLPKPPNVSDEQFNQYVKMQRAGFNGSLGYIQWQRKDYAAAIDPLRLAIADDPKNFYRFYWLGSAYLSTTPRDQDRGIWYVARAVALARNENSSNAGTIEKYLAAAYTAYHGSADGLADIRAQAALSPEPPAGFRIAPATGPR